MERGKTRHTDFSAGVPTKDRLDACSVSAHLDFRVCSYNSTVSRCMFEQLGFTIAERVTPIQVTTITPPDSDPSTPEGQQSGRQLLRFWVEISAWLLDYQRRHGEYFPIKSRALTDFWVANSLTEYNCAKIWVKLDSIREMYQMGIGAQPDQSMCCERTLGLADY
jgi:ubiquitin carboxyl-terminal hydrolase 25/28